MLPESVLSQQHPEPRKVRWTSKIFGVLFLFSVSLNFYLLAGPTSQQGLETVAEAADIQDSKVEKKEETTGSTPAPVETSRPVTTEKSLGTAVDPFDQYEVQQASFFPSETNPGREIKTLHFRVRHSLIRTLCDLIEGEDCKIMSAYMGRLLMWHLDMDRHIRKGDAVSLVYERIGGEALFRILRMEYDSGYLKKKLVANYFEGGNRQPSYYDGEGQEFYPRLVDKSAPIRDYSEITSLPGDFRAGMMHGHSGTDFKAEVGTPIYSSFDGRVTRINWNRRNNGFCVEVDHPKKGVKTLYLHLDKVLVKKGQYVQAGEKIGASGNTGHSFAPHLHYEVQDRNHKSRIRNPFKFRSHPTFRRAVPDTGAYEKVVQWYDSILQRSLS